jgi:nucleoside-diphosphate-sugar epimerase
MVDKETVLVTGASGFIGGWLVETLCLNGSTEVRAGIRSWSSAARLARFPLEIVLCDVMDKEQITQAMTGATIVIHCATGLRDVIVQGTKNMLEVALELGVKRFLHMSTAEVYGNVNGEVDEKTPYQYTGGEYGDAKIDAEKLCWDFYEKGLPLTILRPPIVYGPFSEDWIIRFVHKLQSGNWGIFEGYGDGICNLVYVADVVSGILLAAKCERAVGEMFNLNGPEVITWNQYSQRLNAALGLSELKVIKPSSSRLRAAIMQPVKASAKFALNYLESPLKKIYERFGEARAVMKFVEGSIKTTANLAELNLYNRNAVYLTSKAQKLLGYNPRFNVDTGLQMSVCWLNHLGLVDSDRNVS